jgi:uncharacterized membrane protein
MRHYTLTFAFYFSPISGLRYPVIDTRNSLLFYLRETIWNYYHRLGRFHLLLQTTATP